MTTHGGPRPNAGRPPNAIPSQRIVIHATDDELGMILTLTPRERAERLLADELCAWCNSWTPIEDAVFVGADMPEFEGETLCSECYQELKAPATGKEA